MPDAKASTASPQPNVPKVGCQGSLTWLCQLGEHKSHGRTHTIIYFLRATQHYLMATGFLMFLAAILL